MEIMPDALAVLGTVVHALSSNFGTVEGVASVIVAVIGDGVGYFAGRLIAAPRANDPATLVVALVLIGGGVFGAIENLPAGPFMSFVCGALFGMGCGMHARCCNPARPQLLAVYKSRGRHQPHNVWMA